MVKKEYGKISTGSYDLNKWLYGGYEKGVITMLAGPPACGKTNFCILAACSQARKGNKVLFIDTEGGFSTERVKQIAGTSYKDILKNLLLFEPTTFEEQKEIFIKLLDKLKKQQIKFIIVDGMAMLYRLELGDAIKSQDDERIRDVNREVAFQMRSLAEISRKQKIPILITNQVYKDFLKKEDIEKGTERQVNIVGGDLFRYWSKCIIEMTNDWGKKTAILLKHRNLPEKTMSFVIKDKGIFKKSWI